MGEFHTPMPDASTFIDRQQKEGGTVLIYFDFKSNKRAHAKNLLEGVTSKTRFYKLPAARFEFSKKRKICKNTKNYKKGNIFEKFWIFFSKS